MKPVPIAIAVLIALLPACSPHNTLTTTPKPSPSPIATTEPSPSPTLIPSLTPTLTPTSTPIPTNTLLPTLTPTNAPTSVPIPSFNSAKLGTVERNVPYCIVNGVAMKMDVYYPESFSGRQWPVVIYVHGGSFTAGDKEYGEGLRYFDDMLAKDILVVSVNYRLAPEFHFPAPIEDLKCAIRSLRANALNYNLNPLRMGLFGTSAGAHLTSLAGLAGSGAGFDNSGGYTQTSSRVQAVVSMYGPYDFSFSCKDHLVQLIFGAADCKDTAVLSAASPLSYVGGNAPPFTLFHGELDQLVRVKHSKLLYRALSDAGANVVLVIVENAGHGFASRTGPINPKKGEIVKMTVDFFVKYLK